MMGVEVVCVRLRREGARMADGDDAGRRFCRSQEGACHRPGGGQSLKVSPGTVKGRDWQEAAFVTACYRGKRMQFLSRNFHRLNPADASNG